MNSIVDISKILFVSKSKLLSPNSQIFVILESLCLEMFSLALFILWKKFFLAQWWLGQWSRKWIVLSISWPQEQIGDTQSWLSPSRNIVSNFNLLVSWILWAYWFWFNIFQWLFFKHIDRRRISNIYVKIIPFSYYCRKKEIFEKIMSYLKTRDFIALRTSCTINVIVCRN